MLVSAASASATSPPAQTYDHFHLDASDKAVAVGRDMARCLVAEHPAQVKAALALGDSVMFRLAMIKLRDALGNCMTGSSLDTGAFANMQLSPHALAGLLAEAVFSRESVPALVPAKYDPNSRKLDWIAGSASSLVQLRLGECLSKTQPQGVIALVTSDPSSPNEATAFQALTPYIPGCLDKNVTLTATKSSLRLALAFALYRRSIELPAAGAAK